MDHVFDISGVKIIIDMKSSLYLSGVTLDYHGRADGGGF